MAVGKDISSYVFGWYAPILYRVFKVDAEILAVIEWRAGGDEVDYVRARVSKI